MKNSGGAPLSGHSMKPFVDDPDNGQWNGPDVALTVVKSPSGELNPGGQNYSLRSTDWRYVRYENGKEELYNNANDPYEWNNLADEAAHADKKTELKQKLIDMVGDVDGFLNRPNRLINPDIEYGNSNGWLEWRNNELEVQSDVVYQGDYAMKISADNQSVIAYQNLQLEVGESYTASMHGRFNANDAGKAIFSIKYFDGDTWVDLQSVDVKSDDWKAYDLNFTVEAGKDLIQYSIYRWVKKDFYFDNCFMGKTSEVPTAINPHAADLPQLTVFPNPTSNRINLNGFDNSVVVHIYTVGGTQVKQVVNDGPIDVSDLATGLYLLKVNDQLIKFIKR